MEGCKMCKALNTSPNELSGTTFELDSAAQRRTALFCRRVFKFLSSLTLFLE